jgi:hypothetical protein
MNTSGVFATEAEAQAYAAGQLDALRNFAQEHARLELLGENWRERAVADYQAVEAQRRAEAEQRAEERRIADNIAAGRHPGYRYRGGPVDWESGLPAGSACAWLRNKRLRDAEPMATVTELRPRRNAEREAA